MKYFGSWDNYKEMAASWGYYSDKAGHYSERVAPEGMAKAGEILFASYDGGGYDGDAVVLFERDGKLFEVNGSHCSCYGLEDQWQPEETSWRSLEMRLPDNKDTHWRLSYHSEQARIRFINLVKEHTK